MLPAIFCYNFIMKRYLFIFISILIVFGVFILLKSNKNQKTVYYASSDKRISFSYPTSYQYEQVYNKVVNSSLVTWSNLQTKEKGYKELTFRYVELRHKVSEAFTDSSLLKAEPNATVIMTDYQTDTKIRNFPKNKPVGYIVETNYRSDLNRYVLTATIPVKLDGPEIYEISLTALSKSSLDSSRAEFDQIINSIKLNY